VSIVEIKGGKMMNQEISRIIEMIDRKIRALTQARQTLIDEFGDGKTELLPPLRRTTPSLADVRQQMTRKDAVIKLLRDEGPLSRKEIIDKTGFPEGTIAYVLNDKDVFISMEDKWHLVEETKAESES
jgi:hypothetical protein